MLYRKAGFIAAGLIAAGGFLLSLPFSPTEEAQAAENPDQVGQWSAVSNWPLVAVHSTLLPDGKVLLWDAYEYSDTAYVWTPANNTFRSYALPSHMFCSAHSHLVDGRVFVAGGIPQGDFLGDRMSNYGIKDVNIFDSRINAWSRGADMIWARWYPSLVRLADGRVFVFNGQITPGVFADTPEIYDPRTNAWTALYSINTSNSRTDMYSHAFLLHDGTAGIFCANNGQVVRFNPATPSWTTVGVVPTTRAAAVSYRPGKILVTGGGADLATSKRTAAIIDFTTQTPTIRVTTSMNYRRFEHNLVVLPDGSVVAIGGAGTAGLGATNGVLQAEKWDPATEGWTTWAAMSQPRMYHSSALLLPDGRVLVGGGGRFETAVNYTTTQIFSPPYLFKGSRPSITQVPSTIAHGRNFTIQTPDAASIRTVVLLAPGSITHMLDMNQRYVQLAFTAGTGQLTVTAPATVETAPEGYYQLFIVNNNGVPSIAPMVRLFKSLIDATSGPGVIVPASGASSRSTGWFGSGTELVAWSAGQWLEYNVDVGAGGAFTLSVTAKNDVNSAAPNLPPGFTFDVAVSIDGAPAGAIKVPGSGAVFQTGSLNATILPGIHTIRFLWLTDVYAAGNYDSNMRVKDVGFQPQGSDILPPTISSVAASPLSSTAAAITWNTNEPATSQVEYGLTMAYGTFSPLDGNRLTSHSVQLAGLAAAGAYHFRARSMDAGNNEGIGNDGAFTLPAPSQVAPPQINPNGGAFTGSVSVAITCATADAIIYYTLDGSNPTGSSPRYTVPFSLSSNASVKAKAYKSGMTSSMIASADFTVTQGSPPPASGAITRTAGEATARSAGWAGSGAERVAWSTPAWSEFTVDFPTSGTWTIGVTAMNDNSPAAPNLPAGYAYTFSVTIDGAAIGSLAVPGSTFSYQTGTRAASVSAGAHVVRFTWTNDAYAQNQYDANLRLREVSFTP